MIPGDLLDAALADLVQTRVSNMTDGRATVFEDDGREHAGHAVPFRASGAEPVNLVVGDGDRFSHAVGNRPCFAFETLANHGEGHVRGLAAGGLAANEI